MTRSKRAQTAHGIGKDVSAPKAIEKHYYTFLTMQDVVDTANDLAKGSPLFPVTDDDIERLNGALSDYLWSAEPGTQDREGVSRRRDWFADVETTARHLQALLNPAENSALLLTGVGQPMLWMTRHPRVRMNLSECHVAISSVRAFLEIVAANAGAGRESLERDIFETRTEVDGRPRVLDTRIRGRPHDANWANLANDFVQFMGYVSRKEPTVTIDPTTIPPSRKSVAAQFAARLLDIAATGLPSEKSWAVHRLRKQETRLTEYVEAQRPSKRYRTRRSKRGKSAAK